MLPLGTTNNFARTLGTPLNLPAAITVLTDGKVADVDLGLVGDYPFANLVSVGVSAEVAGHVPAVLKRLIGRGAYPFTALRLLPRHQTSMPVSPPPISAATHCGHQVNIANGSFHAGTPSFATPAPTTASCSPTLSAAAVAGIC